MTGVLMMDASVLSQAVAHQSHFEALLDRIPHHLILPPTDEEQETAAARYFKHRKQAIPKDEKKKMAKDRSLNGRGGFYTRH